MTEKAQVALEYLVMSAFLLMIVGFLFAYAFFNYDQTMKLNMSQHAVKSLGGAADQAYVLGTGTVLFVEIDLPNGITSYAVSENEIKFVLSAYGGDSDIYTKTTADLNVLSSLPITPARHEIRVSMGEEEVTLQEV